MVVILGEGSLGLSLVRARMRQSSLVRVRMWARVNFYACVGVGEFPFRGGFSKRPPEFVVPMASLPLSFWGKFSIMAWIFGGEFLILRRVLAGPRTNQCRNSDGLLAARGARG